MSPLLIRSKFTACTRAARKKQFQRGGHQEIQGYLGAGTSPLKIDQLVFVQLWPYVSPIFIGGTCPQFSRSYGSACTCIV